MAKASDEFSAILHSVWKAGRTQDEIIGQWAEDGSEYKITCPHQLRDLLVAMQTRLALKYAEAEVLRRRLAAAERQLEDALT